MECRRAGVALLVAAGLVVGCSAAPPPRERTTSESAALRECAPATVEGVDVSEAQGFVDWDAVHAAGVDFAIIKATQGTYDTQSTFADDWAGAQAAGVIRSAYHFFDPTEDGVAQAQHFLAVVGTLGPADLPATLDIECPTGSADTTCLGTGRSDAASATDIATRMWDFIHAVEQATGKKPLIYTYGSYFASNGIDTTGLGAYPLYVADPVAGSCFDVLSPWSSAVLWQYSFTGSVPGIADAVDRDRFVGTLEGLRALAGTTNLDGSVDASKGAADGIDAGASGERADAGGLDPPAGADAGGLDPPARADAGGLDPPANTSGPSSGCACSAAGTAGAARPGKTGVFDLALAFVAAAGRRRHSIRRVLAGRSKESPCRRPTSAKG
jgi:lysozyme